MKNLKLSGVSAMALALSAIFASTTTSTAYAQAPQPRYQAQPEKDELSVFVTATRQIQEAKDVLADYTIISSEEIKQAGATSVAEILRKQKGIEIATNGGNGSVTSVFLRGGNNAQTLVLVDGVRVGSSHLGGATWAAIPTAQIDHIEIVYGPLSSLYGADAMNGVIQIFTKQGKGDMRYQAEVGVGSYGLRHAQIGMTGSSEGLDYALSYAKDKSDGFSASLPKAGAWTYNPDKDGYSQKSLQAHLAYHINSDTKVGVNYLRSDLDAQFDAGPSYDDKDKARLQNVTVYGEFKPATNWNSKLQLSKAKDEDKPDASYGKGIYITNQKTLSWQNDVQLDTNSAHVFIERRTEEVESKDKATTGERTTQSLGASYLMKANEHFASASVRHDKNSQFGSNNTGSLAYGYRMTPALKFNGSIGTSFRAPTFNELYYPGYGIATNQPERARNFEIGLNYHYDGIKIGANYHVNKARDLLVYAAVCPVEKATHPWGCAYNVNKATISGLSFNFEQNLGRINWGSSVDVQDPKDDTTGKKLARRANQHAKVFVDYALSHGKVGVEWLASSERFDDAANLNRMGGYGLVNVRYSHPLADGVELIARWNNVANKKYELSKNYATAGSHFYLGLSYNK